MSNKETAKEIFDEGIDNGDSRDVIVVAMVQGGVSLNSAQIYYKEFAQAAGISNAKVGHKAEALKYLAEVDEDLTDDEVRAAVRGDLQEKFGVATSTANDYIKAYAAENSIELPKSNFGANPEEQAKIFDWIVDNKDCDKSAFREFMSGELGRSPGSIDETWRGVVLARKLQAAGVMFEAA